MRKVFLVAAVLMLGIAGLAADPWSAIGLTTPSGLDDLQGQIGFGHRFYGVVNHDVMETFFGTSWGANAQVGYRQHLVSGSEIKLGYTSAFKQYEIGAAWKFTPQEFPVTAQIDATYSSFKPLGFMDRETDIGVLVSAQSEPFFDRLVLTANAGYNSYYERVAAGVGVNLKLTDTVSILGEYYPLLDDENSSDNVYAVSDHSAFSAGLKLETWGHSFVLCVGNAYAFDPVQNSLGAVSKGKLHLGFNIKRRFDLM